MLPISSCSNQSSSRKVIDSNTLGVNVLGICAVKMLLHALAELAYLITASTREAS